MRKDLPFMFTAALLLAMFILLMYLMVTSHGQPTHVENASFTDNRTLSGLTGDPGMSEYYNYFTGDDGMIYTVDGKNIHAIGPDGQAIWSLKIPNLIGDDRIKSWYSMHAVTDRGILYITLISPNAGFEDENEFLAISPQGKILWQTNDPPSYYSAKNGRLYASKNNVTVYNGDGTVAWIVDAGTYPPLVDDTGTMYMIFGWDQGFLNVYDPNGRLKTSYNLTDFGLGYLMDVLLMCPQIYYNDHTVYVPLQYGMVALNDGGDIKWKTEYSDNNTRPLLGYGQFDKNGDIYLQNQSSIYYLTPNGKEHLLTNSYDNYWSGVASLDDGLFYTIRTISATDGSYTNGYDVAFSPNGWYTPRPGNRDLSLLDTCQVTAYDINSGKAIWNTTLPMDEHIYNATMKAGSPVKSYSLAKGMLSNGTLYVNFWAKNTEVSDVSDNPGNAYAGGIYAINKNGSVAWHKPTDSRVLRMNEYNGSVIYCTADGNISAFQPNMASATD